MKSLVLIVLVVLIGVSNGCMPADYEQASSLGSSFAKMQLVALNPYAAMCNKMLAEVMGNMRQPKCE
ncbi:unnamed protein product, partial [Mesorhabditis spiculigera]